MMRLRAELSAAQPSLTGLFLFLTHSNSQIVNYKPSTVVS